MIGASSMIVGIIVLALPISVISTTFGDVWHEWREELRLDAKSKEEDMKSVELALQVIQNRTFMHVEIYDHFERYPAELLGQTEWKSLPIDSKEKVEVADASYSLHPFLGSLVEWRYWSIERFKYTPTNNEVYWSEGDGEREREEYSICIVLYSICMYMYVYVCICMYMYVYVYICMYMYVYVCICMRMYMYMYVYVCICMYMYN